MAEPKNQQQETVLPIDDSIIRANDELQYIDDDSSDETWNSRGEHTTEKTEAGESVVLDQGLLALNSDDNNSVPTVAGELEEEIEDFIAGVRRYYKNIRRRELPVDEENNYRNLLLDWNRFLLSEQGACSIISSDIEDDINKYIPEQEAIERKQLTEDETQWIIRWLLRWNKFLQARAGETLVTGCNFFVTAIGLFLYLLDQVSDITTCIYYVYNGQWWRAILTLIIVYSAIIMYTIWKWETKQIHCTGSAESLRYFGSLFVNWPDVQQYGSLCFQEWKLYKSPKRNARLVSQWHQRRINVAHLKFTEGLWEACPQAILQLYFLVPDLLDDFTWPDFLRIISISVSLCTAGAALVNWERFRRIAKYIDMPTREMIVLHMWAVPVAVSRLLSVALLLTVYPYWGLTDVAVNLILRSVHWCRTGGVPRTRRDIYSMYRSTLAFFISPHIVGGSVVYRRVLHAIHFLCNIGNTVVWALGSPLKCTHPALYIVIICFSAVIFVVGLLGFELHWKYWPHSYPLHNC